MIKAEQRNRLTGIIFKGAILLLQILTVCFQNAGAQEKKSSFTINMLEDEQAQMTSKIFKYKEYTSGKVVSKSNNVTELKMNYNQLSDQILFINPTNDTLEFANPEAFSMIIIGKDSFYFFAGKYLEKIGHYAGSNLAVNQKVRYLGTEKKGAYGGYSATAAISSKATYTSDQQLTTYLGVDQNAVFTFNDAYFISDRLNNFFPANKKNFLKVFFLHETEIKSFLDKKHVNFNKKKDLEQLLQFIQGLPN